MVQSTSLYDTLVCDVLITISKEIGEKMCFLMTSKSEALPFPVGVPSALWEGAALGRAPPHFLRGFHF